MEVILLERVGRLGNLGDKVTVKDGYARNFLLPRSKAVRATKDNLAQFETKREAIAAENAKKRESAQMGSKKFEGLTLALVRASSEDGKLYGSVGARDIELELIAKGFEVSRQQLQLPTTIKNTGTYKIGVELHPEVIVPITLHVVRNESDINGKAAEVEEDADTQPDSIEEEGEAA